MAEQELDRHEPATPYKLERARERGQAARSAEGVAALVFAAAVVDLSARGLGLAAEQFRLDHAILLQAGRLPLDAAVLWPLIQRALVDAMRLLLPLFVTLLLTAVVANVVQTGPILSVEPLRMDLQRLHPVMGFKRVFSLRVLFDALRACVKLVLLAVVAYFALRSLASQFHALAAMPAGLYLKTLVDDLASVGFRMAAVLALVAVLDLIYTRHEFAKKMRMSRRELKDEHKHREGDPRLRARRRELRRDRFRRSLAIGRTRDADVLITNPTHVAVALKYEHGRMASPELLAKGAGPLAASMREIAARHGVPVVQNPSLARQLYRGLEIDHPVPPELHAPVARIIVWVFAMRERRHGSSVRGGA